MSVPYVRSRRGPNAEDAQNWELDTPNIQPTSLASSQDECSTFRDINLHSISNSLPPCHDGGGLSSSPGKQVCEINHGHNHTELGLSNHEDRKGQCNGGEAEVNNKEVGADEDEEHNDSDGDIHEKNAPLPRSQKKRPWPAAGEKLRTKRATKRRRFSSSLSSEEETEETEDESDISNYAPTKLHHSVSPRPATPHTSDDSVKEIGGQNEWPQASRTAIIYKLQTWEGEIVDERDVKQGRGRPRKQYLVRWKQSWVDGARLTALELVQNWREKKASKRS